MGSVKTRKAEGSGLVTHSICSDCTDNLDFQLGVPLQRYLDSLKIPVIALDSAGRMIAVNSMAAAMYPGKSLGEKAEWPDKVFECAHARLPDGCGKTIHCSGCAIRVAVTGSFRSGESRQNIQAHVNYCDSAPPELAELLISTDMIENIVFLRLAKL